MKASYVTYLVFMLVFCGSCTTSDKKIAKTKTPGQHPQAFETTITKTVGCRYLLFLPEGYGQKQQSWPLILFLHGAGQRGDNLEQVKLHGPPKIVESDKDFPFIVVSPQCPADDWWSYHIDTLINLLDHIASQYDVDTKRIYLTGLSMGGYGAWDLSTKYPDRFAAVAPICGGGSLSAAFRLKDLPIWAFHGAKDELVSVKSSEDMVNTINACGGNAKLSIYPDAGHDSWTETYNNKELYDWFLKHKKKTD